MKLLSALSRLTQTHASCIPMANSIDIDVKDLTSMDVEELAEYLELDLHFDFEVAEAFKKNKINGAVFPLMNADQLKSLVPAIGDLIMLQKLQGSVQPANKTPFSTPKASPQMSSTPCSSKV